MKHLKTFIFLLVAFLFSSCFSSNDSPSYDEIDYMTIEMLGPTVERLIGDSNNQLYDPINPELLRFKNNAGETVYPERALIFFSYVAQEANEQRRAKKIKLVSVSPIPVQDITPNKESLDLELMGVELYDVGKPSAANNYITLRFSFKQLIDGSGVKAEDFILYAENSEENTLFLNFVDYRENKTVLDVQPLSTVISYKLDPDVLMREYPNLDLSDSINIAISYDKDQVGKTKLNPVKILLE